MNKEALKFIEENTASALMLLHELQNLNEWQPVVAVKTDTLEKLLTSYLAMYQDYTKLGGFGEKPFPTTFTVN